MKKHISLYTHPFIYIKKKWLHHKCHRSAIADRSVVKDLNGIKFIFDFSFGKNVRKMYHGAYEVEIKEAMKKYLKPGGTFLDIGANIGYLSAIGASLVGKKGAVHSFEPIPLYFRYLVTLTELNPDRKITVNKFALGQTEGSGFIDISRTNIGSNSLVAGFVDKQSVASTQRVEIKPLDAYADKNELGRPSFIKIDVEGFELSVLKGAVTVLRRCGNHMPPVIIEIVPSAYELLNRRIAELEDFMFSLGYKSYCSLGHHSVDIKKLSNETDILFVQG